MAGLALLTAACSTPLPPAITAELDGPAAADDPAQCDASGAPPAPHRFGDAATAPAMMWIWRDHRQDLYCGCDFDEHGGVSTRGCGYDNAADPHPQIDWEQVVAPWYFGAQRACWTSAEAAGRVDPQISCAAHDDDFRAMDADLYNLQPAIGALVRLRGKNPYGMVRGEPREFGACDFETGTVMGKYRMVEPPPDVRGDIARTVFYMAWRYGGDRKIKLTGEQRALLSEWDQADPVDDWERTRACRIKAIQGWANPFVR